MAAATDAGTKTITRRLTGLNYINDRPGDWQWLSNRRITRRRFWDSTVETNPNPLDIKFCFKNKKTKEELALSCPYGITGDVIYVRETHTLLWVNYPGPGNVLHVQAVGEATYRMIDFDTFPELSKKIWGSYLKPGKIVKRPGIHMFKDTCRLWLEIEHIFPQRLKSISEESAQAEGVVPVKDSFKKGLLALWVKINGADSLALNPWVWVIQFKKIKRPL